MQLGLLALAAAWAQDPTGARPGLGPPVLSWTPVLQLVGGAQGDADAPAAVFVAGRVGVEAERKVLRARLTAGGTVEWTAAGQVASTAALGEAWARWSPPISSALGAELTLGLQPLDFDDGVIVGDADELRTAQLPLAAHAQLRALPWVLDLASGFASGRAPHQAPLVARRVGTEQPFHLARLGAGRDYADTRWQAAALALVLPDTPLDAAEAPLTAGASFDVQLRRVRFGGDGYVQPGDAGTAFLVGGRAGWAFGDEARVVLWGGADAISGGEAPAFRRPLADPRERFGWLGRHDEGGTHAGTGALDAWLRLDATIAPQLRTRLHAHHLWDGAAAPVGPELDAELSWYWSPLAAFRLRGGWAQPWAVGGEPTLRGEGVVDVAL